MKRVDLDVPPEGGLTQYMVDSSYLRNILMELRAARKVVEAVKWEDNYLTDGKIYRALSKYDALFEEK